MVVKQIVDRLVDIGFSEYEARAYTALVGTNPATAYETAKISGIPTSKIYETLSKLVERGVVSIIERQGKKRYLPLDPDEFVESRKSRMDTILNGLKKDFAGLNREADISYIWNIYEYEYLLDKVIRMIEGAGEAILLSAWRDELSEVEDVLKAAERRGVKIALVHFGEPGISTGQVFPHPIKETIYSEKGGRGFTMVVDSREAIIGTILNKEKVEGAWSLNSGFVTLAEDYIKHDIYIMKIIKRFDEDLIKKFGKNYKYIRDVFSDKEVK